MKKINKIVFMLLAILFLTPVMIACKPIEDEPIVIIPVDPSPIIYQDYNFNQVFDSNVNVEYQSTVNIIDGHAGKIYFTDAVDEQIELLANDLIYRLAFTFGAWTGPSGFRESPFDLNYYGSEIQLADVVAPSCGLQAGRPEYRRRNGDPISGVVAEVIYDTDITDIAYYALYLSNNFDIQTLSTFLQRGAMLGGVYWSGGQCLFVNDYGFTRPEHAWKWSDIDSTDWLSTQMSIREGALMSYSAYRDVYLDDFKLAIANILAGNIDGYGKTYSQATAEITKLGFTPTQKQQIINFILNEVIGVDNVEYDEFLLDEIKREHGLYLNFEDRFIPSYYENEEIHHYRAYKLIIPHLVDQAFAQKTGYGESVWLSANKITSTTTKLNFNEISNEQFTKIRITPTKTTKLKKVTFHINNIVSELGVTCSFEQSLGKGVKSGYLTSTLNAGKLTVVLDLTAYCADAFEQTGYIELKFSNPKNVLFGLNFGKVFGSF